MSNGWWNPQGNEVNKPRGGAGGLAFVSRALLETQESEEDELEEEEPEEEPTQWSSWPEYGGGAGFLSRSLEAGAGLYEVGKAQEAPPEPRGPGYWATQMEIGQGIGFLAGTADSDDGKKYGYAGGQLTLGPTPVNASLIRSEAPIATGPNYFFQAGPFQGTLDGRGGTSGSIVAGVPDISAGATYVWELDDEDGEPFAFGEDPFLP